MFGRDSNHSQQRRNRLGILDKSRFIPISFHENLTDGEEISFEGLYLLFIIKILFSIFFSI
jgi:hypothetical protein